MSREFRGYDVDQAYYQKLHQENDAFKNNNWLLDELELLIASGGNSLLEVGCGNGRFLSLASAHWEEVVGMDWARSPHIESVISEHPNVSFLQSDLVKVEFNRLFDLVVSADFLEHIAPADLEHVLGKLMKVGRKNLHKVACYDDGHSHLSIFSPTEWLNLWKKVPGGDGMRIVKQEARKGREDRQVIVLTNA